MTPDDLLARRLAGQRIADGRNADPVKVVAQLGAVQAQDYGQSMWALGLRSGATADVIRAAIERGAILRTWPMRGTIHFVPAEDARWMLDLLAGRRIRQMTSVYAKIGLTERVLGRAAEITSGALRANGRVRRKDLYAILTERGIDCSATRSGSRGGHILTYLSMTGLICLGPMNGSQQTLVLLDEWAPRPRIPADPAVELAIRYFSSHGPATAKDLSWWCGLTLREVREAVSRAGPALDVAEVAGERYLLAAGPGPSVPATGAWLLPAFDEFTVAYADRSAVGAGLVPRGELLNPVMVLDGRAVGLWKATSSRARVRIDLAPFSWAEPGIADRFHQTASRYADFLGLPAEISLATVEDVRRMRGD
jgi:hypothetical protein